MSLNSDLEIYLRKKLITRDISGGISRLAQPPERTLLATLRPDMERSYSLLALHLLFIDAGASRPPNMSELLSPFDSSAIAADHATLMSDFALLRLALGIYSMVMGRFADAIGIFENLHWIPLTDPFYRIIRSYCLARCLSRSARYIEADNYYEEAIDQCRQNDFLTLGWVITANRAWPQLQLNYPAKARELLQEAHPHIPEFDYVTLANVHSTYARIFRREYEFYQALNEYEHADDLLRTNQFTDHPSRARILIQWAVTERHIAMQDQEEKKRLEGIHHDADQEYRLLSGLVRTAEFKRLDPRLKRYNKLPGRQYLTTLKEILSESTSRADTGILCLEKGIQERRASAKKHLKDAYQIYAKHNHVRAGNALVHLAYLDIDDGDPDGALEKAVQAETYVANTQDSYLGVTVAVLQNIIYHELRELDPNRADLPSADEYLASARKADDEARKLQNPRLALRAKIAIGLGLTRGKHNEEARAIFQVVMEMKRDLQIKGEDPILWNLSKLAKAIDKMESEKLGRIVSKFINEVTGALKTDKKTAIPAWTEARKAFDAYLLDELCKVVPRKVSNSSLATILGSNRAFLLNELKRRRQSDDD